MGAWQSRVTYTASVGLPPECFELDDETGPPARAGGRCSVADAWQRCTMAARVMVRLLGPVEVVGGARPFSRAWSLELVVYLAVHGAATTDQWTTALWPDMACAPATSWSVASDARRALGAGAGADHLPRNRGRLCLAPSVTTDWDWFRRLAARADEQSWHRALALVRGRPFGGLRTWDWPVTSGLAATISEEIVAVAGRVAGTAEPVSDSTSVRGAVRSALLACPYDERLYRLLLRTAALEGSRATLDQAMAEAVLQLEEDPEAIAWARRLASGCTPNLHRPGPLPGLHDRTVALYHQLRERSHRDGVGRSRATL